MIKRNSLLLFLFISFSGFSQQTEIFPPNWYVGLKDSSLQIIVKQQDAGVNFSQITSNTSSIRIVNVIPAKHKDYLLVSLTIGKETKPGNIQLKLSGKKKQTINYELKRKQAEPKSLDGNDLIYLIMPDRFANGNPANDIHKEMREKTMRRDSAFERHGGDLQGITQHLDYIKDLGATTIWLTPFQENDEPSQSYHGYAITNHYKVDPRFGTMEDYTSLCREAKKQQMKWVLDLVFNHIGDGHWLFTDKPFPEAVHSIDHFTRTNYRANTIMDPYASALDKKVFTEGWFDKQMPDLNNDDPILARYMIQNTIWWIETSQADGIRIDTYSYPEQDFMQQWYKAVIAEYPSLSVFGEIWEHAVPLQSYFVPKDKGRKENMQNVLDFQFCFAIDDAVNQPNGWTEGISKLYYTLSQDYVYSDPYHHVIFVDNHDLDRFYSTINYDLKKMKAALGILLTMRGIPSVFYGTEILMRKKGSHGLIREDMWGGWKEDSINKFTETGRTAEENEARSYIQKLAKWRKDNTAIHGKLMQFVPDDGVYVYFRYSSTQKVMVVYNSNKMEKKLQLKRFNEMLNGTASFKNVITQETSNIGENITIQGGDLLILEVH
jgi:glycosidase